MEYHEAVDFLFGLQRFAMSPGVESTRELLAHLGDPQESFDAVQIAGSNGKGSTARMLDAVLGETDRRVGLYTSPHLADLRERVRVDGRMVTETAVAEFVEAVRPYVVRQAAAGEPVTFFEVTTALALWWFDRADVDVAVLEVGLGGEYDATSAVDPVAAAVTNVSLEHTSVLGDTVEEIAETKARIAPPDAPLVTAATGAALDAVRGTAGAVVTVGDEGSGADVETRYDGRVTTGESAVAAWGRDWAVETRVPLLGPYQARNVGVAAALARQVAGVDEATLARGFRSAHWPGRMEVVEREPTVVLDGAHNPGACETVAGVLSEFSFDRLHLVFGAMHDKDHAGMVAALPDAATVVTCRPHEARAEDPAVLAATFEDAGVDGVRAGGSVQDAVAEARERAAADDLVLVVGSLYCVAEARAPYVRTPTPKRVPDATAADRVLSTAHVPAAERDRTADRAVSRTVHLRVDRRQAARLRAEALAAGGDCAVSGISHEGEHMLRDVVLTGTRGEFAALLDALADAPLGLAGVGAQLRDRLELDPDPDPAPATGSGTGRDGTAAGSAGGRGGDRERPWSDRPAVMGVLNVTPDSFHDGGEYLAVDDAVARAEALVDAGADVVDVGGESTRPGADPVGVETELDRVLPVIEAVTDADADVAVSIDTRKAAVAEAALDAGADVLNDVTGLSDPEMRFLAAERDVPVVVMHSIDAPVVPDREVHYDDVVRDVIRELRERVFLAERAGIPRENVVVDPGLGFGKTAAESFELLGRLDEFRALGCPVLVGHSRKSMFEHVGRGSGERLPATVAATALAVDRGADVVRVHDVPENVAAVRTALAARDPARFDWS
jgi:dihydropteroate synthase